MLAATTLLLGGCGRDEEPAASPAPTPAPPAETVSFEAADGRRVSAQVEPERDDRVGTLGAGVLDESLLGRLPATSISRSLS